jgi:hypothetical protein
MQISWDEAKPHKKWQNLYFVQAWLTNILTVQFLKQHCAKSVIESLYGVQNLKEKTDKSKKADFFLQNIKTNQV